MARAGRVKEVLARLKDLSLAATAVSSGYVGYHLNADEDPAAREERIDRERFLARRRHVEKVFSQLAKHYDSRADELMKEADQISKIREETQTLSANVLKHTKEVSLEIEKLQKVLKVKDELQQTASTLRQQKRTLDAEVQELSKLVKIKEDLQAGSKQTCPVSMISPEDELQILSSKVQERNRVLEAEIEELMQLVKVKELQAKSEALVEPVITHLDDPVFEKDDPAQN